MWASPPCGDALLSWVAPIRPSLRFWVLLHIDPFGAWIPLQFIEHLAPEGPDGEKQKSVKNRAALLHGLAFLLLDLNFGVPRGEQPLGRAPRLGTSGTFLVLFWSQKSTHNGEEAVKASEAPQVGAEREPQGGGTPKAARFQCTQKALPILHQLYKKVIIT